MNNAVDFLVLITSLQQSSKCDHLYSVYSTFNYSVVTTALGSSKSRANPRPYVIVSIISQFLLICIFKQYIVQFFSFETLYKWNYIAVILWPLEGFGFFCVFFLVSIKFVRFTHVKTFTFITLYYFILWIHTIYSSILPKVQVWVISSNLLQWTK